MVQHEKNRFKKLILNNYDSKLRFNIIVMKNTEKM